MSDPTAAIDHADQLWCTLERSYSFLREINRDILEKRKQLKRKEVVISAFGRHKCGKSTLLNLILRNSCLPVAFDNETGIEVKIKHNSSVHPGPCTDKCRYSSEKCPRLVHEITATESATVAQGATNIEEKLHDENHRWRQTGDKNESGHHSFTLYAYVPILSEAPNGWTLALVDTPGFGEAHVDHVTALTDTLFSTSTAYLYLIDSNNLEDEVDAKNIKLLFKHDKDLFKDGRLIVAISKYDVRFTQRYTGRQRTRVQVAVTDSIKNVKVKALSFIADSVKVQPPPDIAIVPVSAHWADTALLLREDPNDEEHQREAQRIINSYPDPQPQGQGEAAMSSLNLAANLERISGLPSLEERLRETMKQCIYIWKTSLTTAYTGYMEEATAALERHQQLLSEERQRVDKKLAQHNMYDAKKQQLTDQAFVQDGKKADIEQKLEDKYAEVDVEAAQRLLHSRIEQMIDYLQNVMKEKVQSKKEPFLQRNFEEDLKIFIQEKAERTLNDEQLNMRLEGVQIVFRNALGEMEELDREIEQTAIELLPTDWSPETDILRKERARRGDRDILTGEVLQKQQLTLGDLHKWTKAPQLKLGFFQWIRNQIRKLFGRKVTPETERPYESWTSEMDEVLEGLKSSLISEVDTYIAGPLQEWVIKEVLIVAFRNRVKSRAEALLGTYEQAVREARVKLEKECRECARDSYMADLEADIQKLKTAKADL
jgi:predicted GTPase